MATIATSQALLMSGRTSFPASSGLGTSSERDLKIQIMALGCFAVILIPAHEIKAILYLTAKGRLLVIVLCQVGRQWA